MSTERHQITVNGMIVDVVRKKVVAHLSRMARSVL
jgi:hypothetical protein